MFRAAYLALVASLAAAHIGVTQQIATTVASAEAEGESFPHGSPPGQVADAFAGQFGGTTDRRCVASAGADRDPGGSLRSGEMIVRSRLTGAYGLKANREQKILWMPLHNPFTDHVTRIDILAARIGAERDTLRLTINRAAKSTDTSNEGFPSLVTFPVAGTWLVVATAGDDWGCFEFTVAA